MKSVGVERGLEAMLVPDLIDVCVLVTSLVVDLIFDAGRRQLF